MIVFKPTDSMTAAEPNLGGLSSCVKHYVKNLGVVFDEHLKFDRQIYSVVKSSFFQLRLLSKAKYFLSFKNLEKVIHAFITSKLDYRNSLWDHITPVLQSLHWLPVRYRVDFKISLIVYKSLNGMPPSYISDLLIEHNGCKAVHCSK